MEMDSQDDISVHIFLLKRMRDLCRTIIQKQGWLVIWNAFIVIYSQFEGLIIPDSAHRYDAILFLEIRFNCKADSAPKPSIISDLFYNIWQFTSTFYETKS